MPSFLYMAEHGNDRINPVELWKEKKLIAKLAKNDFKTKFAGSYLGTVWAFVQPIVTVFVYWFVFEKALGAAAHTTRAGIEVPYVLWLLAGLVPWFFFQDAINSGTNSLIEYNYLVKKVVFKINILPVVKILSSLFVHLFFQAFTIVFFLVFGLAPDGYTVQIFYYSFCMVCLVMGLTYATSAIVIFFRDLSQIVNIILQIGVWATPIMWNINSPEMSLPPKLLFILRLNPMYYVVNGYRESLIGKTGFWESPGLTIYFWIFTIVVILIGTAIFKRLRMHFADVL